MESLKEKIAKEIKKQRPKLSDSSLKTYVSLISTLCTKLNIKETEIKDKADEVLEYVEKIASVQSKKTILSACYIITEEAKFKNKMLDYCNETNSQYKEQRLSKTREDIDFSFEDVKRIFEELKGRLKKSPSIDNYVNYIICALMSGVTEGIAPRRLEYADVKIKDIDKETDNYLDLKDKCIVLNKYKTVKQYGKVSIPIPKDLLAVIKRFLKINTGDHLLVHGSCKSFNASELSKRLQTIFGEKVGCDMLRSVFLSDFYKDMPEIQKMDSLAHQMGHSVSSALNYYVKK